ncbi:MAG: hypothetical protein V9G18_12910 [Albidovulum sp.]
MTVDMGHRAIRVHTGDQRDRRSPSLAARAIEDVSTDRVRLGNIDARPSQLADDLRDQGSSGPAGLGRPGGASDRATYSASTEPGSGS